MRRKFSSEVVPLTEDMVTSKQVKPGDLVVATEDITSDRGVQVFQKGKTYKVVNYYPQVAGGLVLQSDHGPWTVSFRPDVGKGPLFTTEVLTPQEQLEHSLQKTQNAPYHALGFLYNFGATHQHDEQQKWPWAQQMTEYLITKNPKVPQQDLVAMIETLLKLGWIGQYRWPTAPPGHRTQYYLTQTGYKEWADKNGKPSAVPRPTS